MPPIQCDPDTLITNFFIAGLSQKTLRNTVFARKKGMTKAEQDESNMTRELQDNEPEVIFSMYEENLHSDKYLRQVFARKIRIIPSRKNVNPMFFSFMSRNEHGLFQYNHVLIFYERLTEQKVHKDIDELGEMNRLVYRLQNQKEFTKMMEDGSLQRSQFG